MCFAAYQSCTSDINCEIILATKVLTGRWTGLKVFSRCEAVTESVHIAHRQMKATHIKGIMQREVEVVKEDEV